MEEYKAVYCGLCRAMGKRHGFPARFALNYDFTFLVMVLAHDSISCEAVYRRCPAHPFRKRKMCVQIPALDLAADESIILTYHKLRDDVRDNGFFRSLPSRIASAILRRAYRRAAESQPEFDQITVKCLAQLHALEKERCPSLDRPADTFARILQAAAPSVQDEDRDRARGQLLYHVGRWIYLIDAWDDLEDDIRSGSYNPIHERFGHAPHDHIQDVRTTLLHSRNLAVSAYGLAQCPQWEGILSNILYFGLSAVEEAVFAGQWKKKRKNIGEQTNE